MTTPDKQNASMPTVVIVDYGGSGSQLLARRIREAQIYSEVVPQWRGAEEIFAANPAALVLTGGSAEEDIDIDPGLLNSGIPVLATGYAFGKTLQALGASHSVNTTDSAKPVALEVGGLASEAVLFANQPSEQTVVLTATNTVSVSSVPAQMTVTAADNDTVLAVEDATAKLYGIAWDPETEATAHGQDQLKNFLYNAAELSADWTTERFIESQIAAIREQIGDKRAICALSGGVDSAVSGALVQRAVGEQLTCVYVNTGLMRKDESAEIERAFGASSGGAKLVMIDAEADFLTALKDVSDPETKRKIIGERFIRTFEKAQADIVAESANDPNATDVKFLVQGTVYPDIVESGSGDGSKVIKSHHNVGGLPEDLEFELVEPLKALFKDEVRAVGTALGLPDEIVWRHPFPGPGLGIRVVGSLTRERLDLLREADAIVREELKANNLNRVIWQFPVVLLADIRSVGVTDDERTYGHPVVLRPVVSEDAMTADWAKLPWDLVEKISNRITAEVEGINRVVLDVTPKPPGTIEWE